jgi:hypothetical protein
LSAQLRAVRTLRGGEVLLALLAFGFLIFAVRIWVIGSFGNSTPFWDQWDGEAALLYAPWLEGKLTWAQWLAPHNEHRILLPRVLALALLELNGVWNPLLQMVVNAALHVFAICLALWVVCRELDRPLAAAVLLAGVVLFAVPYAHENILGGFQSQFYLLLATGTASMWLASAARPFDRRWWCAAGLALGSYFCMASGALTLVALAFVTLLPLLDRERRGIRPVAAAFGLVAAFSFAYLAIPVLEQHAAFRAANGRTLYDALESALAWPLSPRAGNILVRNAPVLVLLVLVLRDRRPGRVRVFLLGMAAFALAQSAAAAFGRASSPRVPRVLDLYAWAAFTNLLIAAWLVNESGPRRLAGVLASGAWIALLAGATLLLADEAIGDMSVRKGQSARQEQNTREYVLGRDLEELGRRELPHPHPRHLASLLERPSLQAIMPIGLQPPLRAHVRMEPGFTYGGTHPQVPRRPDSVGSFGPGGDLHGGTARMSFEVPDHVRRLAIPVAGYPRRNGMRIEVVHLGQARVLSFERDPGEAWAWAIVDVSPGPLEIVLVDHSAAAWIAIGGVQSAGRFDRAVLALIARPEWPLFGAFVLALALLLGRLAQTTVPGVPGAAAPVGRVSFVIPAYNEEKALGPTIAAIHEAMRAIARPYEVIVADDASTDATARVAGEHGARVVHVEFRQIARTRNAGARAARADTLIFVDADTRVNEGVLRAALAALEAGAVGGGATPAFEPGAPRWSRLAMCMVVGPMSLLHLAAGCFVFVRRAPFEAVGGFDERHFAGEEVMLSRALHRHGRFVILRERVETSARKFIGAAPWKTLWMSLRLAARGMRGVRRREGNEFWYDGKR